jgi:hypothetical protein
MNERLTSQNICAMLLLQVYCYGGVDAMQNDFGPILMQYSEDFPDRPGFRESEEREGALCSCDERHTLACVMKITRFGVCVMKANAVQGKLFAPQSINASAVCLPTHMSYSDATPRDHPANRGPQARRAADVQGPVHSMSL